MSGYLVDTDVLSEPRKPRPHEGALAWLREHEAELYTSAIVIGEIAWGIERLANGKKRHDLAGWLHDKVIPKLEGPHLALRYASGPRVGRAPSQARCSRAADAVAR